MQTKSCTNPKCEQANPQPVTEFYLNRGYGDGYNPHCKSCWRRYLEANREKRRQKQAEYRLTHKEQEKEYRKVNKEKLLKMSREYGRANPGKRKEYYLANKESMREKSLNSYRANPEQRRESTRRWQNKNRERTNARQRERYRERPEVMLAQIHKRRALIAGNGGSYTTEEWQDLCSYYMDQCLACGEVPDYLSPDHIVPLSKGGRNDISNIQPLCLRCNKSKGARTIDYRLNSIG